MTATTAAQRPEACDKSTRPDHATAAQRPKPASVEDNDSTAAQRPKPATS